MLKFKLFGSFSLSVEDAVITCDTCRSPRVLRALIYLLIHCRRRVPLREFSRFLRTGKEYTAKPPYSAGSDSLVKTTLHRIRALLEPLSQKDPSLQLHCRDGGVFFDPALVIDGDIHRFTELAEELSRKEETPLPVGQSPRALFLFRSLLSLYGGRYLEEFPEEEAFSTDRAHYHTLFTELCETYMPLLLEAGAYDELILATGKALRIDPYFEAFHFYKIRATLAKGDSDSALAQYRMAERLFWDRFRVNPSQRLRRLRDTMLTEDCRDSALDAVAALALLPPNGALSWEAFSLLLRSRAYGFFTLVTLKRPAEGDNAPFPAELLSCRLSKRQYAILTETDDLPSSLTEREDVISAETVSLASPDGKIFNQSKRNN